MDATNEASINSKLKLTDSALRNYLNGNIVASPGFGYYRTSSVGDFPDRSRNGEIRDYVLNLSDNFRGFGFSETVNSTLSE